MKNTIKGNWIRNPVWKLWAACLLAIPILIAGKQLLYAQTYRVVLDPGHDAKSCGTDAGGLLEYQLNLQIANYCRLELQKYPEIQSFMTRETHNCTFKDLQERVDYAESVNADIYISLHCNASENRAANGVVVYYPNENYNLACSTQGYLLADNVCRELAELGLKNNGSKYYNTTDNTRYPDQSLADYYAVIRYSKLAGFPGIIIEHAFQTNTSDVQRFLNSDDKLKQLGEADARAILSYLGITNTTPVETEPVRDPKRTTYQGVDYADVYNPDVYAANNPDVVRELGKSDQALLSHFMTFGRFENRITSETFNAATYRGNYPDLQNAFGDHMEYYYNHYLEYGKQEGRDATPNYSRFTVSFYSSGNLVKEEQVTYGNAFRFSGLSLGAVSYIPYIPKNSSKYITGDRKIEGYWKCMDGGIDYGPVFDPVYYLSQYADLKAAFQNDYAAAFQHFLIFGMKEGRQACAGFNVTSYKNTYRDLRIQYGENLPAYYRHYVTTGKAQKRMATGNEKTLIGAVTIYNGVDYSPVYDYDYYVSSYRDVKNAYGFNDDLVLKHFVFYGMKEGRQGRETFNVHSYRRKHIDLENAFGDDLTSYYIHYLNFGRKEGRLALDLYPILGKSDVNLEQMVKYYNRQVQLTFQINGGYLTDVYKDKGAPTIEDFCKIVLDTSAAEGVRAEVVFAQSLLETGLLRFINSDVSPQQCNFAGIGATGNGESGCVFKDVPSGILAQVRHLKLYAAHDISLVPNDGADPRYYPYLLGKAPYVEWLGATTNPYKTGWAGDPEYSNKILRILTGIKSM